MTAGTGEIPDEEVFVGYHHHPDVGVLIGQLSDPDFVFRERTYRVQVLAQIVWEYDEVAGFEVGLAFSPPLDHHDLEFMTLRADGRTLHVSDNLELLDDTDRNPPVTLVVWDDPGFRWEDGQVVDVDLTVGGRPVPDLPGLAVGALALLLALGARRRAAGRI